MPLTFIYYRYRILQPCVCWYLRKHDYHNGSGGGERCEENYKDTEIETKSIKTLIFKYATALIWVSLIKWLKQKQKFDRKFHSIMLLPGMAIY